MDDTLRETIAEALELEPEDISPDLSFDSLDSFDSVQLLSLIVALDDIGVEITQKQASELSSIQDIISLYEATA